MTKIKIVSHKEVQKLRAKQQKALFKLNALAKVPINGDIFGVGRLLRDPHMMIANDCYRHLEALKRKKLDLKRKKLEEQRVAREQLKRAQEPQTTAPEKQKNNDGLSL